MLKPGKSLLIYSSPSFLQISLSVEKSNQKSPNDKKFISLLPASCSYSHTECPYTWMVKNYISYENFSLAIPNFQNAVER